MATGTGTGQAGGWGRLSDSSRSNPVPLALPMTATQHLGLVGGGHGSFAGGEGLEAPRRSFEQSCGRSALHAKETERWLDAVAKAVREGGAWA